MDGGLRYQVPMVRRWVLPHLHPRALHTYTERRYSGINAQLSFNR